MPYRAAPAAHAQASLALRPWLASCLGIFFATFAAALRQDGTVLLLDEEEQLLRSRMLDAYSGLGSLMDAETPAPTAQATQKRLQAEIWPAATAPASQPDAAPTVDGAGSDDELARVKALVLRRRPALAQLQQELEQALLKDGAARSAVAGGHGSAGGDNQGSRPSVRVCLTDGRVAGLGCGFAQVGDGKTAAPLCRCPLEDSFCSGGSTVQAGASNSTRVRPVPQAHRSNSIGAAEEEAGSASVESLLRGDVTDALWADFVFGRCHGGGSGGSGVGWKASSSLWDEPYLWGILSCIVGPPIFGCCCFFCIFLRNI